MELTGFRMSKAGKIRVFADIERDVEMAPKEALPGVTVKLAPSGLSVRYWRIVFCYSNILQSFRGFLLDACSRSHTLKLRFIFSFL